MKPKQIHAKNQDITAQDFLMAFGERVFIRAIWPEKQRPGKQPKPIKQLPDGWTMGIKPVAGAAYSWYGQTKHFEEEAAPFARKLNNLGYGIYFAVNDPCCDALREGNIEYERAIYQDNDSGWKGDLRIAGYKPHFTIRTSRDKTQSFWLTDDMPLGWRTVIHLNMVEHFGHDKSAGGSSRLMRLPGYRNTKYDNEPLVTVEVANDLEPRITAAEIDDFFGLKSIKVVDYNKPAMRTMERIQSSHGGGSKAREEDDREAQHYPTKMDVPGYDGAKMLPETFKRALAALPDSHADEYQGGDGWLDAIMAAHHEFAPADGYSGTQDEDVAIKALETFSSRSPDKYTPGEVLAKWKTCKKGKANLQTMGTLVHHAKANGFEYQAARGEAVLERINSYGPEGVQGREKELLTLVAEQALSPYDEDAAIELIHARKAHDAPNKRKMQHHVKVVKEKARKARLQDTGIIDLPDVKPSPDGLGMVPLPNSLNNHKAWHAARNSKLAYNQFTDDVEIKGEQLTEGHVAKEVMAMHNQRWFVSEAQASRSIETLAHQNEYHPVQEYFKGLEWDGTERVGTWLIDYCHAKDTPGIRCISKLFLIAVVMRIFHPGCKFDYILTLLGKEGLGKSKLAALLAVRREWLLQGLQLRWGVKELLERTQGIVVAEYAEMAGHSKGEQDKLKDAASRTAERTRLAYGRRAVTRQRSYVIIANANNPKPLVSAYGNRRIWPVEIAKHINVRRFERDRDQLYAEAYRLYLQHIKEHGPAVELPEEHWQEFGEEQESRRETSTLEARLEALMEPLYKGGIIRAVDLYSALGTRWEGRTGPVSDVRQAMERLGWEWKRVRFPGGSDNPLTCFVKGSQWGELPVRVKDGFRFDEPLTLEYAPFDAVLDAVMEAWLDG